MEPKKKSYEAFRKEFSTDAKCEQTLFDLRMRDTELCLNPDCKKPIKDFWKPFRSKRKGRICGNCLHHFYAGPDSIFSNSHMNLSHCYYIIYLMLLSRRGIPGYELHRQFGYGTPAVYRYMHRVRTLMGEALSKWKFTENSTIEVDESYITQAGNHGLGRHYNFKPGRNSDKSVNILAMAERTGNKKQANAKLFVIPDSSENVLISLIAKQIDKSCLVVTDSWPAYNSLKEMGFKHITVNHRDDDRKKRYVNDSASTNLAESIFSIIKRSLKTHGHFGSRNVMNFLNEVIFRYNYRNHEDYGFSELMKTISLLSVHYGKLYQNRRAA